MTPDDLLCNELHGRVEDTVHRVQADLREGWCQECKGYTHAPWCSQYETPKLDDGGPREASEVSEAASGGKTSAVPLQSPGMTVSDTASGAELRQTPLLADPTTIRTAIADVLDIGYLDADGRERAWLFLLNESDEETNRRGEFLDAVIARIQKLKEAA